MTTILRVVALLLVTAAIAPGARAADPPLKVLFLGDQGHHRPADRFAQIADVLAVRGIELEYTEDLGRLTPAELAAYDALAVYANIGSLSAAQEGAVLEYVRAGKGLVPLHCASFCFQNSPAWINLVGAQFQKHGTGEFRTLSVAPEHPVMKGFGGFESWDETYVHTKHNPRGRPRPGAMLDSARAEPGSRCDRLDPGRDPRPLDAQAARGLGRLHRRAARRGGRLVGTCTSVGRCADERRQGAAAGPGGACHAGGLGRRPRCGAARAAGRA